MAEVIRLCYKCNLPPMFTFWTPIEKEALARAKKIKDLVPIAFTVLDRMPRPISMASGPITTGGLGSREKNLDVFADVIHALQAKGENVFNQLPFQNMMADAWRRSSGNGYFMEILEDFYAPVLRSKKITRLHFIPGWKGSVGARWEFEQCRALGIEAVFLSEDFFREAQARLP